MSQTELILGSLHPSADICRTTMKALGCSSF